jgi:hypothetical protein
VALYVYPSKTLAFPPGIESAVSVGRMWSAELFTNEFIGRGVVISKSPLLQEGGWQEASRFGRGGYVVTAEEQYPDQQVREKMKGQSGLQCLE